MRRLCLLGVMLCLCGCGVVSGADDYRDVAAVDLAISTMVDSPAPQPGPAPTKCARCKGTGWITHGDGHRTPCPECQTGSAGQYGSPFDTFRDAKALIAKGNALADRGKAILDAAEVEGKIVVDVQLPKTAKSAQSKAADDRTCPDGVCPYAPKSPPKPQDDATTANADAGPANDFFRPRLLKRLRR